MSALLIAGLAGLVYGTADLLGGVAARRAGALAATVTSQTAGAGVLLVAVLIVPGVRTMPTAGWGMAAGLAGALGTLLFYRALAHGRMAQVAPITMTSATAVPVAAGIALGELPTLLAAVGVAVALVAIALVALGTPPTVAIRYRPRHLRRRPGRLRHGVTRPRPASTPAEAGAGTAVALGRPRGIRAALSAAQPEQVDQPAIPTAAVAPARRPLVEALAAGVLLGVFAALLQLCGSGVGLWPLVWARVAALVLLFGAVLAIPGPPPRPEGQARTVALAAGGLETGANIAYLLALQLAWQHGRMGLVAVLASLSPIWTTLLAWSWLRERLGLLQGVGLGLAATAIALVTMGSA